MIFNKIFLAIIKKIDSSFDEKNINMPFDKTGIDSLGFLTLRVELEKYTGSEIPNSKWNSFSSFKDIIKYFEESDITIFQEKNIKKKTIHKDYKINMPQMNNNALSENWLFKEFGSLHWELLCGGLGQESSKIIDEEGNRLYATFIRIKLILSSLRKFSENEDLVCKGEILRYGTNNYFSNFSCKSDNKKISADLMTTFSKREGEDNLALIRCNPNVDSILIPELKEIPQFATDYRLMKKGMLQEYSLDGAYFDLNNVNQFETEYNINPYYDLNGVGLLYFASYPIISDYCESTFFNEITDNNRWEDKYFTVARDMFYHANCNIDDKIVYNLNEYEFLDNEKIIINSTLFRKSDKALMANIFTVKKKFNS